ncbi:putative GTP-binding protein [Paratrimastix pyriformis]|uniref:GTP-binding protein n=1 Tax=Paratrimastix pyriformis TaxID=342808 RepID=A0ABQ8UQJ9_9EUKA|nr:putative GTP-binding protein [Paratrimastix pyriformis]
MTAPSGKGPNADFKVVLLGDTAVGKTALVERYSSGKFLPDQPPTFGASFFLKTLQYQGTSYRVGIWDTAGQEKFDCLSSFYTRGAACGIVCYSLVDNRCKLDRWLEKLMNESGDEHVTVVLCGTKSDLTATQERVWDADLVREYATRYHALHFETSAVTGDHIEEMFDAALAQMVATHPQVRAAVGQTSGRGPAGTGVVLADPGKQPGPAGHRSSPCCR